MKIKIVGMITAITMLISVMPQIMVNAADDITISTAQELKTFADSVNAGDTYEGKTVLLTQDIELDINEIWSPIGGDFVVTRQEGDTTYKTQCKFSGNFDGQNHTISGMNADCYETNYGSYQGLFGYVYEGTVKNLTVKGIINITESSKKGYIGGAVAYSNYANLENIHTQVTITGENSKSCEIGGVAGSIDNYSSICRCSNKGSITVDIKTTMIGGIVGYVGNNSEVYDCSNLGSISSNTSQIYVGGVVGTLKRESGYVNNCYNYGKLTCNNATLCGGVIGEKYSGVKDSHIKNNYYLDTSADDVVADPHYNGIESKTDIQFASGEVAYLLNNQKSDGNLAWYQNIGTDDYPMLDNTHKIVLFDSERYYNESTSEKHIHKICADENCTDEHEDIEWTVWDSADTLPTEAGNYYLTSDVEISSTWTPADDTKLCLNGHTIKQTEKDMSVITLSDSVFTLCDCVGTGKITGGRCGVFSIYQSTFNMYGGIITENKWDGSVVDGGGVVVYPYNTFNMFGGEISGNCDAMAGGVHLSSNGSMNIGGKVIIKDNTNTGGNIANVLPSGSGSQINIVKPLKKDAYIGIAYHSAFTKIPCDITTENDTDYSGYFHSDNNRYAIENGENNIVRLIYKNSDYPYYEIRDIKAFDTDRHELSVIPPNTDFKAYFVLQQISDFGENDFGYAIAAIYDTDGALIGVRSEKITRYYSAPTGFYFDVSSKDKTVGSIKAFVWDGFDTMKPLAETKKLEFPQFENFQIKTSIVECEPQDIYSELVDDTVKEVRLFTNSKTTHIWKSLNREFSERLRAGDVISSIFEDNSFIQNEEAIIKYADIANILDMPLTGKNDMIYKWDIDISLSNGTRIAMFNISQIITDDNLLFVTKNGFTNTDDFSMIDDSIYEEIKIMPETNILRMETERDEVSRYVEDTVYDMTIEDLKDAKNYGCDCSKILVIFENDTVRTILVCH